MTRKLERWEEAYVVHLADDDDCGGEHHDAFLAGWNAAAMEFAHEARGDADKRAQALKFFCEPKKRTGRHAP